MDIFKICCLNSNGDPYKVYIFANENDYKNGNIDKTEDLFSKTDFLNFKTHNVEFKYCNPTQYIYNDDNIKNIKRKILSIDDIDLTYDEIYLFANTSSKYNIDDIFNQMSKNSFDITHPQYTQFIKNININKKFNKKNSYNSDDIEELDLSDYIHYSIPLGKEFSKQFDFLFSANPFNILDANSPVFENNSNNNIITFDNSLLHDYNINDKIIYLTSISDVLSFADQNNFNNDFFIDIYFNSIKKYGIVDLNTLTNNKSILLKNENKKVISNTKKYNQHIDLFYTIFHKNKSDDLDYIINGINNVEFSIYMNNSNILPLDTLFKILHTSKNTPFIKFNPGKKKENIFRIFSLEKFRNGKNVPYLNKFKINTLSRTIGKSNKQIAFYNKIYKDDIKFQNQKFDNEYTVIIELFEKSIFNIKIQSNTDNYFDISDINYIVSKCLNPIIKNINLFIEQYGYHFEYFENYNNHNIKVNNIDYCKTIRLKKKFKYNEYKKFINNIFVTIDDTKYNSFIELTYKRVSNYTETDVIKKKIHNMFNGYNASEIIAELIDTFDISEDEAIQNIRDFESSFNVINGKNIDKIVENPGFKSTITFFPNVDELQFLITDIDSFEYIKHMNIYLDTILHISQTYTLTNKEESIIKTKINTDIIEDKPFIEAPIKDKPVIFKKINTDDDEIFNINKSDEKDIDNMDELLGNDPSTDDDDDDDDEGGIFFDDDDIDDDDEMLGGSKTKNIDNPYEKENIVNLDGMPLEKPNLFYKRLLKRDPELFLTKKDGNFNAYSRICQHNSGRQPVILTEEEKNNLQTNYPNSYPTKDENGDHIEEPFLKYGSNKNKQYYYTCPKFWCLKTDSSISEQDVNAGKCGKIIPKGSKTVPKGHYIIQMHTNDKDQYPGFLKENVHSKGHCVPCCIKEWNSKLQSQRRNECMVDNVKETNNSDKINTKDKNYGKKDNFKGSARYIISFDSFVKKDTIGFLTPSVADFFQENYSNKLIPGDMHHIKDNTTCLVRYIYDDHPTQSFIGCLAIAYNQNKNYGTGKSNSAPIPSISKMKEIIKNQITLDKFIELQNGSLINIFKPKVRKHIDLNDNNYSNSKAFKQLNPKNEDQILFFKDIILAYNNFQEFLKDDTSVIDHNFMWGIVTKPGLLFDSTKGLNLIILQKTDNDPTDNIELLCPTNYSDELFDPERGTIIMIKTDNKYELVILYKWMNDFKELLDVIFYKKNTPQPYNKRIFEVVASIMTHCKPRHSKRKKHHFKVHEFVENHNIHKVKRFLQEAGYDINKFVINFQGKSIALLVNKGSDNKGIVVPIKPSEVKLLNLNNDKFVFMDDETIYSDYDTTIRLLKQIKIDTDNKVLCEPKIKVLDDGLIVGILTETNQFIQILKDGKPEEDRDDGIKTLDRDNYIMVDKAIINSNKNKKRNDIVNRIQLETLFYNAFRNTAKILLRNKTDRMKKYKKKLIERIKDDSIIYKQKLNDIQLLVRWLLEDNIKFENYSEDALKKISNIYSTCVFDNKDKSYCLFDKPNNRLLIPDKHLISGYDNEEIYYYRLADELIRYKNIQQFILDPKVILTDHNIDYDINNEEFIILESLLDSDYFDNSENINNKYVSNITYDIAMPQNLDEEDKIIPRYNESGKNKEEMKHDSYTYNEWFSYCTKKIKNDTDYDDKEIWKKYFKNTKEYVFGSDQTCITVAMNHLAPHRRSSNFETLRTQLAECYKNNYEHLDKIVHILRNQGKKKLFENFNQKKNPPEQLKDFTSIIKSSPEYYLTDLDIFALSHKTGDTQDVFLKNVILFSNNNFNTMNSNINWLLMGNFKNKEDIENKEFYFIRACNFEEGTENTPQSYSFFETPKKLSDIGKDLIDLENYEKYKKMKNICSFEEFIKNYEIK